MTAPIVLASANPDKVAEIRAILTSFELLPRPEYVPDVEEDGETFEDNARLKAIALVEATGKPAVADDTGLEVDALGGAPGIRAARYAGENATYADNCEKLLQELDGVPAAKRTARFRTVALLRYPDDSEVLAEGVVAGHIALAATGEKGFGYDPLFIPDDGDGRTFAEMTPQEKHAISHRGRAFRSLGALLAVKGKL